MALARVLEDILLRAVGEITWMRGEEVSPKEWNRIFIPWEAQVIIWCRAVCGDGVGEVRLQECGRDSSPVKAHTEQSPALRWGSGAEVAAAARRLLSDAKAD